MAEQPEKKDGPKKKNGSYDAQDITVLEGLEAVRKRPGMYIGSTGQRGLHHLIYEVMDNSVDEALAGEATEVEIAIHPDNSVTVTDNGRGIPVDIMAKEKKPAAEVVLTVLHAGGKFGDGGGYKVSGGLHGVGVSVVNALSEWLHLTVWRDGFEHTQSYERGAPMGPLEKGAKTDRRGTSITFLPDLEIFETIDYDRGDARAALPRDGLPHEGPQDRLPRRARRRALRDDLPVRRRHPRLRQVPAQPGHPRAAAPEDRLPRGLERHRRGRGRDAVEQLLPGDAALLRQQHQHARGRHAPVRLPLGAHRHDQPLRAPGRRAEGEGSEPSGRGRARGSHRDHLGEDRRPAVRGPDQDQARQPARRGLRAGRRQQGAGRVPRGEPRRGAPGDPQGGRCRPRARRRPQGARPDTAQVRARELHPARQARRLLRARPGAGRDLHRRG